MKSKRTRTMLKPLANGLANSEDDNSSSVDDTSDCELSEDEWNLPSKKYRKNKKKTIPKQTLKMKLAEKTRHLRKISQLNSAQTEEKCEKEESKNISKSLVTNDTTCESLRVGTKTEFCKVEETETKLLQPGNKSSLNKVIKHDSDTMTALHNLNVKNESMDRDVVIKEENKKEIFEESLDGLKVSKSQEPIVIMYSINRTTTPVESRTSTTTPSPSPTLNHSSAPSQHQSVPLQMNSFLAANLAVPSDSHGATSQSGPSAFQSSPGFRGSVSPRTFVPNQPVSKAVGNDALRNVNGMAADRSAVSTTYRSANTIFSGRNSAKNIRQQYSSPTLNLSPSNVRTKSNVQRTSPQQTQTCFQRTPSTSTTLRISKITQRTSPGTQRTPTRIIRTPRKDGCSLGRTRKLFSPGQNERSPNSKDVVKCNATFSTTRNATPLKSTSGSLFVDQNSNNVNNNSVLKKFNNISPNGTVIHTGTGSVTITPRKVTPERPPVQRKLFKNEIEGTISCRSVRGTLQYVVNLANGTHIALTNFQVQKLREQHNGVLPVKLKIPVPCDVADKIEPSFLIED